MKIIQLMKHLKESKHGSKQENFEMKLFVGISHVVNEKFLIIFVQMNRIFSWNYENY